MVLGLILSWIFSRIKYHIKYALYHVTVIFLGMIAFLFLLLRPGNPDNIIIGQIVYYLTNLAWWFGIRIKVEGEKHLKKLTTPCVIMANHQTSLDFLVILKVGGLNVFVFFCTLGWYKYWCRRWESERKNQTFWVLWYIWSWKLETVAFVTLLYMHLHVMTNKKCSFKGTRSMTMSRDGGNKLVCLH